MFSKVDRLLWRYSTPLHSWWNKWSF